MKPKLLLPLIALCAACHNAGDSYEIDIRCSDCGGVRVSLWQYTGSGLYPAGLTKMEHGRAEFKGDVETPSLMYVYVEGASDYLPLFVENGDIDIDFVYSRPSRSVVAGSQSHKKFNDFLQSYSAYSDKGTGIEKMIENAEQNQDTMMLQRLRENLEVLKHEEIEFQTQYVVQNINSPVAAYILCASLMYDIGPEKLDSIVGLFGGETANSDYVKLAADYLAKTRRDTVINKTEL
ncbi:MAG: DUF4369 domain-containing protein [Bacteroidales bacterium]|nr:DUF4369 domain-containing protein [Bacteroidales bacterium]